MDTCNSGSERDMNRSSTQGIQLDGSNGTIQLNSTVPGEHGLPNRSVFDLFLSNLSSLPVEIASMVLLSLAFSVNGFVLTALSKIPADTLQAKFLLASNLIADVTFPLLHKLPLIIIWMCMAFDVNNDVAFTCLNIMVFLLSPLAHVFQGFCSFSLAFDRVFAVCFPLTYKIKAYSKLARYIILLSQTLFTICVFLPAVILPLNVKSPFQDICTRLRWGYFIYTRDARNTILLIQVLITFATYTFIFIYLKCKTVVDVTEKHGKVSQNFLSLTTSYFMLHLTTVLLTAPTPLYSLYLTITGQAPTAKEVMVAKLLTIFQIMNCLLDPILLVTRIPALRKKLWILLNMW